MQPINPMSAAHTFTVRSQEAEAVKPFKLGKKDPAELAAPIFSNPLRGSKHAFGASAATPIEISEKTNAAALSVLRPTL